MKKISLILGILFLSALSSAQALYADDALSADTLSVLKRVSEKQDRILQALEELKSELQIVKIRVSSQ